MMGKVLIPDGEAASDPSWTVMHFGAFNGRRQTGSARQFVNKLRMTNSVPLGATTDVTAAVVGANEQRALLVMQNNSTATSPDSAPTFFFGFGTQPMVGFDLALPPGVGIVMDVRTPSDAIYVAFGPFSNTGGSVVIQGVVKEGGVTDPVGDTVNMSDSDDLRQLVTLLKQMLLKQQ
jgi:hypothetical protein